MDYSQLVKWFPAELGHALAPFALKFVQPQIKSDWVWKDFWWKGLYFRNCLGIAGGVDKNAENILDWQRLGVGFLEVGTITPLPQSQNPGKVISRDWEHKLLWNRMGFPSEGADEVFYNLLHCQEQIQLPVFVNIGKNRETENQFAFRDYASTAERLLPVADAFVVNVSSPNTQNLRALQKIDELKKILESVLFVAGSRPLLVKLSPDLSFDELHSIIDLGIEMGLGGFVLTNTTLQRPQSSNFPKEGGLSGSFLTEISKKSLQQTISHLGSRKKNFLLVSVGGVLTPQDIEQRLILGADLVQAYSAFVFQGPQFISKTYKYFIIERPQ
jgi:dihydroorotate dehydrogenase